jgi:uncharacterized RDD family membrane protein YckC
LHCPKCGVEVPDSADFCPSCGERQQRDSDAGAESGVSRNARTSSAATSTAHNPALITVRFVYAGFWRRAVAYFLDAILLGFTVVVLILGPLMQHAGLSTDNPWVLFTGANRQVFAVNLLVQMACWPYWALMESSPWRATLGKRIMKLEVTDVAGRRLSFPRASLRYFGRLISGLTLLLGFLMAGFTPRKQALHDILAGTLVVRKVLVRGGN